MRRLDDWLFNLGFQRGSEWVEGRWEWNCFWLGKICILVFGVAFTASLTLFSSLIEGVTPFHNVSGSLVFGVMVAVAMLLIDYVERSMRPGSPNAFRYDLFGSTLRLSSLFLAVLVTAVTVLPLEWVLTSAVHEDALLLAVAIVGLILATWFLWAATYFVACTPLPPKPKILWVAEVA